MTWGFRGLGGGGVCWALADTARGRDASLLELLDHVLERLPIDLVELRRGEAGLELGQGRDRSAELLARELRAALDPLLEERVHAPLDLVGLALGDPAALHQVGLDGLPWAQLAGHQLSLGRLEASGLVEGLKAEVVAEPDRLVRGRRRGLLRGLEREPGPLDQELGEGRPVRQLSPGDDSTEQGLDGVDPVLDEELDQVEVGQGRDEGVSSTGSGSGWGL